MYYRRRASPKHRYNIIEEDYGGGGHRTRLNNQLVCIWGAPSPVYKGVEEGRVGPLMASPRGESYSRWEEDSSWPADPLPLAPLYTGAGGTSRHNH